MTRHPHSRSVLTRFRPFRAFGVSASGPVPGKRLTREGRYEVDSWVSRELTAACVVDSASAQGYIQVYCRGGAASRSDSRLLNAPVATGDRPVSGTADRTARHAARISSLSLIIPRCCP